MHILLFRHGIALDAVEASAAGIGEHERPLTPQGIRRTAEAVQGLRVLLESVELIAHSPLTRARQTADLLAGIYPAARRAETRTLRPGVTPETLAQFVAQRARRGSSDAVILVGHEPGLSLWAGWALTGKAQALFGLKKAGACLIEFEGAPQPRAGKLLWLMTAGALRKLG